jgi:hypothetical protein
VITCHRSNLEARCTERGYTLAEVMPCVASQDGDEWTIDVEHPAYPRVSRLPEPAPIPTSGPGTELKKILARVGIVATPDCSCNAYAILMNANGCDWVEANMPTVVGWLREQAHARGLPFLDAAGRALVRVAVRNARRAATHP